MCGMVSHVQGHPVRRKCQPRCVWWRCHSFWSCLYAHGHTETQVKVVRCVWCEHKRGGWAHTSFVSSNRAWLLRVVTRPRLTHPYASMRPLRRGSRQLACISTPYLANATPATETSEVAAEGGIDSRIESSLSGPTPGKHHAGPYVALLGRQGWRGKARQGHGAPRRRRRVMFAALRGSCSWAKGRSGM